MVEKLANNSETKKKEPEIKSEFLTSVTEIMQKITRLPKTGDTSTIWEQLKAKATKKSDWTFEVAYSAVNEDDILKGVNEVDLTLIPEGHKDKLPGLYITKIDSQGNTISSVWIYYDWEKGNWSIVGDKDADKNPVTPLETTVYWVYLTDKDMMDTFLEPLKKRFNEAMEILESRKRKALHEIGELAKNDQIIPEELERRMNTLS